MRQRQIVFVNQSSGYMMIDIVNAFADKYDKRVLITGLLNARSKQLDCEVKIERIIPYIRTSSIKRLYSWSIGFLKALWLIKLKYRNADLFLVSNPPFCSLIPLICSNRHFHLIYDVYPDVLLESGTIKRKSLLFRIWEKANRKVFKSAYMIFTLTPHMKNLLAQYASADKINIAPLWSDQSFITPLPKRQNEFLQAKGWADKFVVMYSGNMGSTHPVEVVIELARHCKVPEIIFVLIGGGEKFLKLSSEVLEAALSNLYILEWQPTHLLPFTLTAADIGIVTISEQAANSSIPSKTFDLMSAGVPILGIAPPQSALAKLIKTEAIGNSFRVNDIQPILNYILDLFHDKEKYRQLYNHVVLQSKKFSSANAHYISGSIS